MVDPIEQAGRAVWSRANLGQDLRGELKALARNAEPMARVRALIERGQHDGAMRRDLDAGWLTSCFTAILHTAAGELRAGRLAEDDADRVVAATVVSLSIRGISTPGFTRNSRP